MRKETLFALLLMGFTSLTAQMLLIREFLAVFYGNELTIGIILANWIILEALGSIIFYKFSLKSNRQNFYYAILQAAIALYLPVSVLLIRNVKNALGLTLGEGIGILPIFASSFLILAPLSFCDGAQFPFGCRIYADAFKKPLEAAGKVYILEAAGFILAGPIFTYLLITRLNSSFIASFLSLLNLFSAILLIKDKIRDTLVKPLFLTLSILLVLMAVSQFGLISKLDMYSLNRQWRGQKVLSYKNSIFANLVVTKSGNQHTFYYDGIPIITTPVPDIAYAEDLAHLSLLSCPNPKNILLLNGAAGGIIKEILKHPVEKITYVELDPQLIKLLKDFPTELTQAELNDPRLEIQYTDGRRFLRLTKSKYDVVILNLPIPSTLQLNRFFTHEFFLDVKSALNENGIFSFTLPGSLSYLNQPLRNLNSSILNTLQDVFYTNIIPGDYNLYLAAINNPGVKQEIILERLKERRVASILLNKDYLQYRLNPRWLRWFNESVYSYAGARKNFDLFPAAAFYSIAYQNSIFSPRLEPAFKILDRLNFRALFILICLLALGLFILKAIFPKLEKLSIGFAIASTGFVGLSFELIFIYTYQSFYGFIFSHLALLAAAFMSGLTSGGWLMTKRLKMINNDFLAFSKVELSICMFCLIMVPTLIYLNHAAYVQLSFVFFLLSAACGFMVGLEFPLANKIYGKDINSAKTAGLLYALDLAGACLAALAISIAFVPVIGILNTCLLLLTIKITSFALIN